MGGACGTHGREVRCILGLVVRSKEESPLRRPRCKLEDNVNVELQEVVCSGMDWMDTPQYRERWRALYNEVMNLWVP